jgi:hypothetical protein
MSGQFHSRAIRRSAAVVAVAFAAAVAVPATAQAITPRVVCEENCPPTSGTYQVLNGALTMTATTMTGTGKLVLGDAVGNFSFNFRSLLPFHPPNPCIPPNPILPPSPLDIFAGSMTVNWGNETKSTILMPLVIVPPTPIFPPTPVRGLGIVTSGALPLNLTTIQWTLLPPQPLCPINTTFDGTVGFQGLPAATTPTVL